WQGFAPLCGDAPEQFLKGARAQFAQRTWELHLATLLLERDYELEKPPADGPDIMLLTDEGRVWLEAVAPEPGQGKNKAERRMQSEHMSCPRRTRPSCATRTPYKPSGCSANAASHAGRSIPTSPT